MFGTKAAIEGLTLLPLFERIFGGDQLAGLKFFIVFLSFQANKVP
jgi:hypothetical protein